MDLMLAAAIAGGTLTILFGWGWARSVINGRRKKDSN